MLNREESSLPPTQWIRELWDKRNRWSTSWKTRCHLYLHTTSCFTTAAVDAWERWWWGMTQGCDAWSCCLGFSPACWRPGKETASKGRQRRNKSSFWRVSSTLGSERALQQCRWCHKGNCWWLLLETQPEPLRTHSSNKLKPAEDLPWMCRVDKKYSLWTTTSWCLTNILSVSVLQHLIIPLHIYRWFKDNLLIFT